MRKLRIWWIPQVPMEPFYAPVRDICEAKNMLALLASYDQFQLENNIKPDFSNAGGLEVLEFQMGAEWEEWENENGDCIDDVDSDGNSL